MECGDLSPPWSERQGEGGDKSSHSKLRRQRESLLCVSVALERQAKPGRSYELKGVHSINCPFNRQPTERGSEQSDLARPRKADLRAVAKANPFRPRYTKTQAASPPESDEACCQRRSNGREQSLGLPG